MMRSTRIHKSFVWVDFYTHVIMSLGSVSEYGIYICDSHVPLPAVCSLIPYCLSSFHISFLTGLLVFLISAVIMLPWTPCASLLINFVFIYPFLLKVPLQRCVLGIVRRLDRRRISRSFAKSYCQLWYVPQQIRELLTLAHSFNATRETPQYLVLERVPQEILEVLVWHFSHHSIKQLANLGIR